MEWKVVPGFDDYEVSRDGFVRSTKRGRNVILKRRFLPNGYARHALYRETVPFHFSAHRLVWEAFVGPIPSGMQVNHKNGLKDDNRLDNLEVVTCSENMRHRFRELGGVGRRGSKNNLAKLTEEDIPKIRALYASGKSQLEVARHFGIHRVTVSKIINGQRWPHIPLKA